MTNAHGIPTVYAGINFRSRAEARWAAFFDQLGWGWEYEPIDLDGYIPDFMIRHSKGQALIEVKGSATSETDLREHVGKVWAATKAWYLAQHGREERRSVLLVPSSVNARVAEGFYGEGSLGFVFEPIPEEHGGVAAWDAHLINCQFCKQIAVCTTLGGWGCEFCREGHKETLGDMLDATMLRLLWSQACNATQWKRSA